MGHTVGFAVEKIDFEPEEEEAAAMAKGEGPEETYEEEPDGATPKVDTLDVGGRPDELVEGSFCACSCCLAVATSLVGNSLPLPLSLAACEREAAVG